MNLGEKFREIGGAAYEEYLGAELKAHWAEIVDGKISAQIKPVEVRRGVLLITLANSSFKDQLKYFKEEILETINGAIGYDLLQDVRIMIPVRESARLATEEPATLSAAEMTTIEEQVANVASAGLRWQIQMLLISRAKAQARQVQSGWHKCGRCENLCADDYCETCLIELKRQRDKMLFEIMLQNPELSVAEVRQLLIERMPEIKKECPPDTIESARVTLIQTLAGRIPAGEATNPLAKKLVAVKRRMRVEDLTPSIIARTLKELRFNMAHVQAQ